MVAENAGQHDQFFKQLENASDGFSIVSEYFGRGVSLFYTILKLKWLFEIIIFD